MEEGVHVVDPVFAGSDALATARALAAALRALGPFDLVVLGRNSVDADTGQVGPQITEFLDLPFAASARHMEVGGGSLTLGCEVDDGHKELRLALPAVTSKSSDSPVGRLLAQQIAKLMLGNLLQGGAG